MNITLSIRNTDNNKQTVIGTKERERSTRSNMGRTTDEGTRKMGAGEGGRTGPGVTANIEGLASVSLRAREQMKSEPRGV